MLGLTSTAGVATIVLGAITLSRHKQFLSLYRGEGISAELQASGRSLSLITNITLGVAAASAISTLVLGLLTRWRREGDERLSIAPGFSSGGGSLVLTGTF